MGGARTGAAPAPRLISRLLKPGFRVRELSDAKISREHLVSGLCPSFGRVRPDFGIPGAAQTSATITPGPDRPRALDDNCAVVNDSRWL